MESKDIGMRVESVRRFNRFYTKRIGVVQEKHLRSPFSLAEVRVMYDLSHRGRATATDVRNALGLDAGYMSRIVRDFKKRGLIGTQRSEADGREIILELTARGKKTFAGLNARSHEEIKALLEELSPEDQVRLVGAMSEIETLLGVTHDVPYILRPPRPGDMGWVIFQHGKQYADDYGWDEAFEALVTGIVVRFMKHHDPKRERCWIAEKEGENVGSIFLVKKSEHVAKLRLLIVTPKARGLGIGSRLIDECVRFARQAGYTRMTLWTQNVLVTARHLYEKAGFELVEEKPHREFGNHLIGETWEMNL